MAAGRAWARGTLWDGGDRRDDALSDAEAWGMALTADDLREDEDGVWRENAAAVEAFLTIQTQWRAVGVGSSIRLTGLDYPAAIAGIGMARIELTPALWTDIQFIEAGARQAMLEAHQ